MSGRARRSLPACSYIVKNAGVAGEIKGKVIAGVRVDRPLTTQIGAISGISANISAAKGIRLVLPDGFDLHIYETVVSTIMATQGPEK